MKNIIRIILFIFPILMLSGCCCGIGGMWVNGNPFPSPHKPVLYSWYKDGVSSEETRMQDWIECGGAKDGDFSPYIGDLEKEKKPNEENDTQAYDRLWAKLKNCMQSKGYTRLPNETVDKMYESRKINGKWQWVRIHSSPPPTEKTP